MPKPNPTRHFDLVLSVCCRLCGHDVGGTLDDAAFFDRRTLYEQTQQFLIDHYCPGVTVDERDDRLVSFAAHYHVAQHKGGNDQ